MTRVTPDPQVAAWYMSQDSASLFTTTVTLAEVYYGLNLLPEGRRRNWLSQFADDFFNHELAGKILSFDNIAGVHYARIRAAKRRLGLSMTPLDAQIAAIAVGAGALIATRNVNDFEFCGVAVTNPWTT
jgi:toxin FitB